MVHSHREPSWSHFTNTHSLFRCQQLLLLVHCHRRLMINVTPILRNLNPALILTFIYTFPEEGRTTSYLWRELRIKYIIRNWRWNIWWVIALRILSLSIYVNEIIFSFVLVIVKRRFGWLKRDDVGVWVVVVLVACSTACVSVLAISIVVTAAFLLQVLIHLHEIVMESLHSLFR